MNSTGGASAITIKKIGTFAGNAGVTGTTTIGNAATASLTLDNGVADTASEFNFGGATPLKAAGDIVTDKDNFASGVLIRAVYISNKNERVAAGPGLVTKAFEVDIKLNSLNIFNNKFLSISKRESHIESKDLIQTTRIGISKAKNIKWRWYLKRSRSISKREKGDRNPNLKNSTNNLSRIT